jgi:hypothetical protein
LKIAKAYREEDYISIEVFRRESRVHRCRPALRLSKGLIGDILLLIVHPEGRLG